MDINDIQKVLPHRYPFLLIDKIVEYEPDHKPTLKKEKLTTRDSRSVERKKYGHRKARRSFQFSKR